MDMATAYKFPMPGEFWAAPGTDQVPNRIVIASTWLPWVYDGKEQDDGIGTLLLNPEAPYYTVQLWYPSPSRFNTIETTWENIVPAAAAFQADTGAWGGA